MKKDRALFVAGFIFALVAFMHLLRLSLKWDVYIAGYGIPMEVSLAAVIVASLLAIWMFRARKSRN